MYANAAELYDVALTEQYGYPNYYGHGPWYMDSGATGHVASESHKLDPGSTSSVRIQEVRTRGGESQSVHGVGTATVNTSSGEIKLTDVKYVSTMKKNLISVGRVTDLGHLILFSNTSCWILDKFNPDHIIATGHRDTSNGLYRFESSLQNSSLQANTVEEIDVTNLWHRRFGHLSFLGLSHLETKQRVIGLPKISLEHRVCACCLAGQQHREHFSRKSETRAQKTCEIIHSYLMGPMQYPSLAGSRYVLVFTDDFSRKSWTYFLKSKDETFEKFRIFKAMIENETGNKIKTLRSDRGGGISFQCLQIFLLRSRHTPRTNSGSHAPTKWRFREEELHLNRTC
jgi:hypothetical protein